MSAQEFESASGVRPAMLYAGMAVVLTAVAARAWAIATDPEHHQPRGGAHEERTVARIPALPLSEISTSTACS
jgi:hypothetical protein